MTVASTTPDTPLHVHPLHRSSMSTVTPPPRPHSGSVAEADGPGVLDYACLSLTLIPIFAALPPLTRGVLFLFIQFQANQTKSSDAYPSISLLLYLSTRVRPGNPCQPTAGTAYRQSGWFCHDGYTRQWIKLCESSPQPAFKFLNHFKSSSDDCYLDSLPSNSHTVRKIVFGQ
jgi:hypothetical protein